MSKYDDVGNTALVGSAVADPVRTSSYKFVHTPVNKLAYYSLPHHYCDRVQAL